MRETNDGFRIARTDLELRGPGEVLGVRQTGLLSFKAADLARDEALMPLVRELADELLQKHPEAVAALTARWIGVATRYGQV
jgi:ATP-dependent DNA helicase RecG